MSSAIEHRVGLKKSEKSGLREKMGIISARAILQSIVETPEAIINDPLKDFVFPYSTDQIRQAVTILSKSIRSTDGRVSKNIEKGVLICHFLKDTVCLGLDKDGNKSPELEYWFPIKSKAFSPKGTQRTCFKDNRGSGHKEIYSSISSEISTDQFRSLWLGFRWMSANLLIWEKINEIIMPEDLGQSYVPRIDIGSEKVNPVELFCGSETAAKLKIK